MPRAASSRGVRAFAVQQAFALTHAHLRRRCTEADGGRCIRQGASCATSRAPILGRTLPSCLGVVALKNVIEDAQLDDQDSPRISRLSNLFPVVDAMLAAAHSDRPASDVEHDTKVRAGAARRA